MSLPNEIIMYIFSISENSKYYLLDKRIYRLWKDILIKNSSIKNYNRNQKLWLISLALKNTYKLIKDIGRYRERILFFIADKNKSSFIYQCQNSYHRMLVHQFCEQQNLKHETICNGYKTKLVCKICHSANIRFDKYIINKCRCLNCYRNIGYIDAIWRPVETIYIDLKSVIISKK